MLTSTSFVGVSWTAFPEFAAVALEIYTAVRLAPLLRSKLRWGPVVLARVPDVVAAGPLADCGSAEPAGAGAGREQQDGGHEDRAEQGGMSAARIRERIHA